MMLSKSAIEMAPPFSLVSKFFITAALFLGAVMSSLPFLPLESPMLGLATAGVVHLYFLGFVMMIIMGALYQLVPVVLEVPFSTLKGSTHLFVTYTFGTLALGIGMILNITLLMHLGGGLVYLSLFYFSVTFLLSFRAVTHWTLVGGYLLIAGILLIGAISFGMALLLLMTGSYASGDVIYLVTRHASLALGGFVMLIVMGVSLILLPMFALAHNFTNIWGKLALVSVCTALGLGLVSSSESALWGFLALAGLFYLIQVLHILSRRMRKQNDYWFGNLMASFGFLLLAIIAGTIGYISGEEKWLKVAFFLAAIGFGFHFVMGHMYKILPFLIWYKYISPLVGKQKVPMLHEMIFDRAAYAQMWLGMGGTLLVSACIVFDFEILGTIGGGLLALSAWAALYNVWYAYTFKQ